MRKTTIPLNKVPQLAKTDIAYATGDSKLSSFFYEPPTPAAFEKVLRGKQTASYPRNDLVNLLKNQYATLPVIEKVQANIDALRAENTFTVTTAHQPCLFLGPLYVVYKALTTINLAESIERNSSDNRRIIPVFVLGSEDHDLEELNQTTLFGKKIVWDPGIAGAVGSISVSTLEPALSTLKTMLGADAIASTLFDRVERAYSGEKNFAEATQALLHELLGAYGLVVINMNNPVLKRHFIPVIRQELFKMPTFGIVNTTISKLNALGFKTQAAPREINLFYMKPGLRERIIHESGFFKILNTDLVFSAAEIEAEFMQYPERFSPNVVLRPLFQEMILPNLAYIGGGGELAYWLERKDLFDYFKVPFPILVRRHSVLWLDKDAGKKLEKLGFSAEALFGDIDALVRTYIEKNSDSTVALSDETTALRKIYDAITEKASRIDATLEKAVRAEEVKAVAALQQWESRLLRAEKQKHEVAINQLKVLKEKFFPSNGLQERTENVLPYLLKYGDKFLEQVKSSLEPYNTDFVVLQASDQA
jgi:bacillithiol biosynthesis cysteine-adding enzyme BshC